MALQKLLSFLTELDSRKIHYMLAHHREEAIMVLVAVPGQRWEIEFFADSHVEVEVFKSASPGGGLEGEEALESLFRDFSD
ncbi:hypothetical protein CDA63_03565 [Hymenobacter amundsenii]|uniref:Uncharacterized protein n=1 Tax=Hymenobacter amundsenii TaxID=2006685 RepID=A0A246FNY3_9BACT|nr:hypothetical protein [Hymenobacter amundsenii]OWP64461.1 hypothetical protein CDA63_03565 [Hymenobacter amundsenii]